MFGSFCGLFSFQQLCLVKIVDSCFLVNSVSGRDLGSCLSSFMCTVVFQVSPQVCLILCLAPFLWTDVFLENVQYLAHFCAQLYFQYLSGRYSGPYTVQKSQ